MSDERIKVSRFGMNQIIPLATGAMALLFIWLGLGSYGFWSPTKGPLPGFFPVIIAAAMLTASLVAFVFSFKEEAPLWPRTNWLVVLSGALIIGASFLIGLLPSLAVYLLVWLKAYERYPWKTTLITSAAIMAIVLGVFVLWLGVPFPKGIIYQTIFG